MRTSRGREFRITPEEFKQMVLLLNDKDVQFIELKGFIVNKSTIEEIVGIVYN